MVAQRECDYVTALATLHQLVGRCVTLQMRTDINPAAMFVMSGKLSRGYEGSKDNDAPVFFDVDRTTVALWARECTRAWRCEGEIEGHPTRLLSIEIEFANGASVQFEELPGVPRQ
jgi:hypothetical protein